MPPKRWYHSTKLHGVTDHNIMLLIFTAVINLKCRVVLPCFFFPVNLTQSVYTQDGHNQTSTECYCRLRIVWDIQRKVSTGGQLVWHAWFALKVDTQKGVSDVLYNGLSKKVFCASTRIVYVRRFSCSCYLLQAQLPKFTAADRYIQGFIRILCVCDTVWIRLDSLSSFTSFLNTNSCVRLENISPLFSVLSASNAILHTNVTFEILLPFFCMFNLGYYSKKLRVLYTNTCKPCDKTFLSVILDKMQICLCAVLLCWTDWNCCPLNTCCSPVTHIHTRSFYFSRVIAVPLKVNPYPTAFPYGNGMVLHFYQQQESSTTKTVHKVINKGLKTYV